MFLGIAYDLNLIINDTFQHEKKEQRFFMRLPLMKFSMQFSFGYTTLDFPIGLLEENQLYQAIACYLNNNKEFYKGIQICINEPWKISVVARTTDLTILLIKSNSDVNRCASSELLFAAAFHFSLLRPFKIAAKTVKFQIENYLTSKYRFIYLAVAHQIAVALAKRRISSLTTSSSLIPKKRTKKGKNFSYWSFMVLNVGLSNLRQLGVSRRLI